MSLATYDSEDILIGDGELTRMEVDYRQRTDEVWQHGKGHRHSQGCLAQTKSSTLIQEADKEDQSRF